MQRAISAKAFRPFRYIEDERNLESTLLQTHIQQSHTLVNPVPPTRCIVREYIPVSCSIYAERTRVDGTRPLHSRLRSVRAVTQAIAVVLPFLFPGAVPLLMLAMMDA